MPIYDYKCPNCGCITEKMSSVVARNKLILCPNCNTAMAITIGAPMISDTMRMGIKKPGTQFNDIMDNVKSSNPHHTISS